MNSLRLAVLGVILSALAPYETAHASNSASPAAFVFYGGYAGYAMDDANAAAAEPGTLLPGTSSVDGDFSGGFNAGGAIRVFATHNVFLQFGADYMSASQSGRGTFLGNDVTGKVDLSGLGLCGSVGFLKPATPRIEVGAMAGAGYYFSVGTVSLKSSFFKASDGIDGNGFGIHGAALAEYTLRRTLRLSAAAGYRAAKTSDVKVGSSTIMNADGSDARIDWTGLFFRLGLTFYPRGRSIE